MNCIHQHSCLSVCCLCTRSGALVLGPGVVRGDVTSQVVDLRHRLCQERKLAPACVRLLNATDIVGCGTAGLSIAPLLHLQDAAKDDVAGQPAFP